MLVPNMRRLFVQIVTQHVESLVRAEIRRANVFEAEGLNVFAVREITTNHRKTATSFSRAGAVVAQLSPFL